MDEFNQLPLSLSFTAFIPLAAVDRRGLLNWQRLRASSTKCQWKSHTKSDAKKKNRWNEVNNMCAQRPACLRSCSLVNIQGLFTPPTSISSHNSSRSVKGCTCSDGFSHLQEGGGETEKCKDMKDRLDEVGLVLSELPPVVWSKTGELQRPTYSLYWF